MNSAYQQTTQGVSDMANSVSQSVNDTVNEMQKSFSDTVKSIDIIPSSNSTREFFESNSVIARFSFLIMAIFIFVVLLKIFIRIIAYFLLNKDFSLN